MSSCTCRMIPDHKGEVDFEVDDDCPLHGRKAVGVSEEDPWNG